jgi:phage terminase large subunit-like protein
MQDLMNLPDDKRAKVIAGLGDDVAYAITYDWEYHARPQQIMPPGDWSYWLILAGRGFGKTRTGAETVRIWARTEEYVNLIGATADDARDIMVEGESGILACCPKGERPDYKKADRKLIWPNGATSLIFTADEPERLRGKQHSKLWGDETASWRYPEAWDQAKFGLRLGDRPQAVITTTPRSTNVIRDLIADPHTVTVRGTTYDNKAYLAPTFFTEIVKQYEGTRLGRQELMAELLEDTPGALWRRSVLDEYRVPRGAEPVFSRVVIAVDPAVSTGEKSDETGIVVVGLAHDDKGTPRGYVLEDASGRYSPDEWSRQVAALNARYDADCIVGEANMGGDMVAHLIKSVLPNSRVSMVTATRGKVTRAEPVSALYEQGRVSHVGRHDQLEDQMVAFTSDFDRKVQGYSPDRVDALVWALTELFPRIIKKPAQRRATRAPKPSFF